LPTVRFGFPHTDNPLNRTERPPSKVSMNEKATLPADNLPFAWDRIETAESLLEKLGRVEHASWPATAGWLLREAKVEQVWRFLTLEQVHENFDRIRPFLGRRLPVWEHLLEAAHELGRL